MDLAMELAFVDASPPVHMHHRRRGEGGFSPLVSPLGSVSHGTAGTRDFWEPPRGVRARLPRLGRRVDASVARLVSRAQRVRVCVCTRVYARVHKACVSAVVPKGGVNRVCVELSWLRQSRATTGTAATGTGAARSPTRRIRGAPRGGGVGGSGRENPPCKTAATLRSTFSSRGTSDTAPHRAAPSLQQATPPSDTELSRVVLLFFSLTHTHIHTSACILALSLSRSLFLYRRHACVGKAHRKSASRTWWARKAPRRADRSLKSPRHFEIKNAFQRDVRWYPESSPRITFEIFDYRVR